MSDDRELPRILLITVNEFYYIPRFLDSVLNSDDFNTIGIITVPPSLGTQGMGSFLLQLIRTFGARVFFQHARFYAKHYILDFVFRLSGIGGPYSPKSLAGQHDIEYHHVRDINSSSSKQLIRDIRPDIIASVAATQKFDEEVLELARDCSINIHSSLLPEYRGVSPGFWSLLNDEEMTGLTVHYMDESLDTGDVIIREPLEIREDDTLHSLNTRVADRGSVVLLEALEMLRSGQVEPTPIDPDEGSYYSMPDREDVREFLKSGKRFY